MAATWDEIKRLASDFQRAQLSSTTQRLAERNCHEIVDKLINLGLLEVIYTSDGKSYLTPQELEKEIQEEVIAHSGRVNLVTIQHSLNVNMTHIENKTVEIVSHDPDMQLILGQIIHVSYLDQMARDINDQLQDLGQVTFAALTKDYDLPGDFLKKEVGSRIGELVFGKVNPSNTDVIYTDSYINRHKARIRGLFSAVTRPTSVTNVMSRYNIPEVLLYDLLGELIASNRLKGTLSGNKTTYTPTVYSEAQSMWVKNFYTQNGYIEYDAVARLGITDGKSYIKKLFKNAIMLNACCVSESCLENLDVAVEECLAANSYMDAMTILPSVITAMDGAQLVQMSIKSHRNAILLGDTIVTTQEFINKCAAPFEELMQQKAKKDMKLNASVFADLSDKKALMGAGGDDSGNRKDDRKKRAAAASKSGGGTQGREVKSKAVKSKFKGRGGANRDSDDEDTPTTSSSSHGQKALRFMTDEEIVDVIGKLPQLEECADVMKEEIAARLNRPLRDKYQEVAKAMFMESSTAQTPGGGAVTKRKQQADLEEKINALYSNIKLFDKSIKIIIDDEDSQANLSKYLLKTLCSETFNATVNSLAAENMITCTAEALQSVEGRAKIISNLPDNVKDVTGKVHTALNGKSIDTFDEAFLSLLSPKYVGILLKKADKKRDRQIQFNHRMTLIGQLKDDSDSMDAATTFHQCVVLLFGAVTQTMLHCSGRLIPQIVRQLKPHLSDDNFNMLTTCQDLIIQQVKGTIEADDERLADSIKQVKELASTLKKSESGAAS